MGFGSLPRCGQGGVWSVSKFWCGFSGLPRVGICSLRWGVVPGIDRSAMFVLMSISSHRISTSFSGMITISVTKIGTSFEGLRRLTCGMGAKRRDSEADIRDEYCFISDGI